MQLQMFSSELQFISSFMKLFHLEQFVIYGIVIMIRYDAYLLMYLLDYIKIVILRFCNPGSMQVATKAST